MFDGDDFFVGNSMGSVLRNIEEKGMGSSVGVRRVVGLTDLSFFWFGKDRSLLCL